jgi:hypothetical protein
MKASGYYQCTLLHFFVVKSVVTAHFFVVIFVVSSVLNQVKYKAELKNSTINLKITKDFDEFSLTFYRYLRYYCYN